MPNPEFRVRVLLGAQKGARPEWPCPAGVTVQLKKGQSVARSRKTNAEGVIERVELEPGSKYQVSITDPGFALWDAAELMPEAKGDPDKELTVWLTPKPGFCFLLLRLVTSGGDPVPAGSVKVTAGASGFDTTFTSYPSGHVYAVAPSGAVTLGFQLEGTEQQLCPRDFLIPYTAAAATQVRPLEIVYWPTITITVSPTVIMPGSSTPTALPGARAKVEYRVSADDASTSRTKTLAKAGIGEEQPSAVVFEYAFPGQYTITVTPPPTFGNTLIKQTPQVTKATPSPGNFPVMAQFETVPSEQINFSVTVPGDQQLTEPLHFQVYGVSGITIPVETQDAAFTVTVPQGEAWQIRLDPTATTMPTVDGKPIQMANQSQAVTQGTNIVFEFVNSITVNAVDEQGHPVTGAVIDVFDSSDNRVGSIVTDANGSGMVGLLASGMYFVAERSVGGEAVRLDPVPVKSGAKHTMMLHRDRGSTRAGGEGLTDLSAYPVLTEEISTTGPPAPVGGGGGSGGPGAGYGQTVDQVMRDVLGWRPSGDVAGFQAALTGAFQLRQVEGHTEWSWQQRGYAVQADMGALTGAQASIYARAKSALDQIQPLLAGLTPLNPALYEPQDLETIRIVVSTELQELVNELALAGGPRIQRVNELFRLLVGENRKSFDINPDLVQGQLGILRQRFGLTRDEVQTVDEERIVTNFRIIVEQVLALQASWYTDRELLSGVSSKTSLGTLLIWLSRGLEAVCESVNDLTFSLDSVYIDAAQRQVVELRFANLLVKDVPTLPLRGNPPQTAPVWLGQHEAPMFLADLLDWVVRASRDEGPRVIQDAGKQGIFAFQPVLNTLRTLVRATGQLARERNDLPAGMQTPRVGRAIKVLAAQLDEAASLASLARVDPAPQVAFASIQNPNDHLPVSGQALAALAQIEIALTGTNFRPHAKAVLIAENREDIPDVSASVTTVNTPSTVRATFINPSQLANGAGTTWQVSLINNDETQSVPIEVLRVPR